MKLGNLYHGDCLEIMPRIPDESVDLILCDLPYGTTASKWDKCVPMDKLWREYSRILKKRVTIALFCVQPFTSRLVLCEKPHGMRYRYMWVWIKNHKTNFGNAHKQPLRQYEEIAVFGKEVGKYNPQGIKRLEKPKINKPKSGGVYRAATKEVLQYVTGYPTNVLWFDAKGTSSRYHPNEKPIELLRYLIRTYTDSGDIVLDNTMGSGSTCVAAVLEGRRYIGIEKDEKYYDISCERVADAERSGN